MSRLALASQASQFSRTILASVPSHVRFASAIDSFLRLAFDADDVMLTIGLQALVSMEKAGTQGVIEGVGASMEELRPFIKRNALGKLKHAAMALGGKIYNLSLAGRGKIPMIYVEQAWGLYTGTLSKQPISGDKSIGEVIKYIANGFTMKLKDVLKVNKRREELHKVPEMAPKIQGQGGKRQDDRATWNQVERKLRQDPRLQGPDGEPLAWIYLDGQANDNTQDEIVQTWNEASRTHGGPGKWTRAMLTKWLTKHKSIMRDVMEKTFDPDMLQQIRLAVKRGALERRIWSPFERELIGLLA